MAARRSTLAAALLAAPLLTVPAAEGASLYHIRGAGFGHGVGMSQYGAYGYAQNGWKYDRILRHYYTGTRLGSVDGRQVRVLMDVSYAANVRRATRVSGRRIEPGRTYSVTRSGSRLVVRNSAGRPVLTRSGSVTFSGRGYTILGNKTINGFSDSGYRGKIDVRLEGENVAIYNVLGIDDYIRGVIPSEVPSSWHPEALKAQAVAARTYAVTAGSGSFLYPDTRSQVYNGMRVEVPSTDAAVQDTRGEVVTYDGRPVITYYFSTSGGRTENVENSFAGSSPQPWLKSVEDPYDSISPLHRWTKSFSAAGMNSALGDLVPGTLRDIRVVRRGRSPRVVSAKLVGTRGVGYVDGATLRARLGTYDTWMYFTKISGFVAGRASAVAQPAGLRPASEPPRVEFAGRLRGRITAGKVRAGQVAQVQRRIAGAWVGVRTLRVGADGYYGWSPTERGTYRVKWDGLAGPALKL